MKYSIAKKVFDEQRKKYGIELEVSKQGFYFLALKMKFGSFYKCGKTKRWDFDIEKIKQLDFSKKKQVRVRLYKLID